MISTCNINKAVKQKHWFGTHISNQHDKTTIQVLLTKYHCSWKTSCFFQSWDAVINDLQVKITMQDEGRWLVTQCFSFEWYPSATSKEHGDLGELVKRQRLSGISVKSLPRQTWEEALASGVQEQQSAWQQPECKTLQNIGFILP